MITLKIFSAWYLTGSLGKSRKYSKQVAMSLLAGFFLISCSPSLPEKATKTQQTVNISTHHDGATLPPNIAPLNFRINEPGDNFATHIWSEANTDGIVTEGNKVEIDEYEWHELLKGAKGHKIYTDIYIEKDSKWTQFPRISNPIAKENIDSYITYRLIEPSYIGYEEMMINQRDITTFDEKQVYNNMMLSDGDNGQCINCHMPRNYNRGNESQFHVRQTFGGTVFIHGDKAEKVNLKTDSTLSAGVYPAWHPTQNLIAYSVNETGQMFHTHDVQKIEVLDFASDLILYDVKNNIVYDIDKRKDEFESFPTWSPDGKMLYYVSAHYEQQSDDIDAELGNEYKQLKYNIYRRPFDEKTMKFGNRELVFDAATLTADSLSNDSTTKGKSAAFPRISPDGHWLLFSLADYGQFHVWHNSANLWMMNLETKKAQPLTAVNTERMESYHTWSSNGRWIMFTSRREDNNFTRLYFAYVDEDGKVCKPFPLPQQEPDYYEHLFKSFNTPEFLVNPVATGMNNLRDVIEQPARPASYGGSALLHPDASYQFNAPDDKARVSSRVHY